MSGEYWSTRWILNHVMKLVQSDSSKLHMDTVVKNLDSKTYWGLDPSFTLISCVNEGSYVTLPSIHASKMGIVPLFSSSRFC